MILSRIAVCLRGFALFAVGVFFLSSADVITAQSFPDHAIRVVVPYPAGGPTDTIARVVTQNLGADLGQSVIVENQAGAGATVIAGTEGFTTKASESVASAATGAKSFTGSKSRFW